MDRHPWLLAAASAVLFASACGTGDADAHQSSAAPAVDPAPLPRAGDGAIDDEFAVIAARYEARPAHRALRRQLAAYGTRAVTWAGLRLAESRDELPYAEVIAAAAGPRDAELVRHALDASRDAMARHRLAATLIHLGDDEAFDVLIEGLESANAYDRSDAASVLAEVAERLPDELRARVIELLRTGRAADAGGVTARGYDASLRILGVVVGGP